MPNPRDIPKMIKLIGKHRVSVYPALPALFKAGEEGQAFVLRLEVATP